MSGLRATARNAFAEVAAKPAALATQMTVMMINDLAWVIFWVLFFDRVGTLGAWDRDSIIVLQAVLTAAGGLSLGLLANGRRIGVMAVEGDLDAVLALPVAPLPFVLLRRVEPVNLGDLAFGIVLFFVACDPTPARAPSRSCSWCWPRPPCSPRSSCSPARWRSSSGAARAASSGSTACSCSAPTPSTCSRGRSACCCSPSSPRP